MSAGKQEIIDSLASRYGYYVDEDPYGRGFIGKVHEFESLSTCHKSYDEALDEIKLLVSCVIEDMLDNGEELPKPRRTK